MKNLFVYYLAILLPIPLLISISNNSVFFTFLLLSYIVFRGFVDGQRLIEKGVIEKKDLWKSVLIPFWSSRFFRQLYLEK